MGLDKKRARGFFIIVLALMVGLMFSVSSSSSASSTGTVSICIRVPIIWSVEVNTPAPNQLLVLMKSNVRQWEVILGCENENAIQWRLADSDDEFQDVTPEGVQILSGPAGDYSPGTKFELKRTAQESVELVVRWHSIYPDEQGGDGAEGGETIVILE